jgi:spore germination protein YaaH
MRKKFILISLILLDIVLITTLLFLVFSNRTEEIDSEENSTIEIPIPTAEDFEIDIDEIEEEIEEKLVQEEEYVLLESAWLPPWYFSESFDSLKGYNGVLDVVNPVFYSANSNGSLLNRKPNENIVTEFLEYCKSNDISVVPTVGSYSYDIVNSVFSSENSYMNHITNILVEVDKYDFDGIDIDYEMIRRERKENYINFLLRLGEELNERGKILSVTVFAQWGDSINYENHGDTIYVQDLSLISDIADQVRVMTYDYTLSSSPTPGPIGPIDWMEDVLEYVLTKVPKEKVWLGIHLYGYRWKDGQVTALTPASFKGIVTNPNINTQFKEDIAEGYAQYGCDSTTCYLYYQTKKGIHQRRSLASEYELAGVSFWSLGKDDGLLSE